jgi:hypothetical protein
MAQNALLDFIQSMSNSAASNVSAPVDLISWGLRKAGVPVGDAPMGGSDWMKQKGLTKDVENKFAGLLGETVGGLAPILAAAKAAQIAKGLLQGAENMAAPRTLNPQTGAVVWHGSPHKFDKFDASKIGTGEGAQAYGHGLYLAESPEVAGSYAKNLTDINGGPVRLDTSSMMPRAKYGSVQDGIDSRNTLIESLKRKAAAGDEYALKSIPAEEAKLQRIIDQAQIYKVDLPDEHIAKMLDWDKPLSGQHPDVQKTLGSLIDDNGYDALQSLKTGYGANFQGATGQDILRALERNTAVTQGKPELASSFLEKQGIPGIRYLDGGSRGAGAGSSNFVVFPGNEGLLSIIERNGQTLP